MKYQFLKPNHPTLSKVAKEIPEDQLNTPQIKKIAKLMLEIICGEQKKRRKGVGLAAPQIGILKRIILVDVKADGKGKVGDLRIYINPEIIWKSKRIGEWYEGCFSTGQVCGIVSRPVSVKVRAFTYLTQRAKTKLVTEKHTGYAARIFQHEIDHLNGKVFVDHITDSDKLHWVLTKEFNQYRKSWKTWPNKCSFEKWQSIKNEDNLY